MTEDSPLKGIEAEEEAYPKADILERFLAKLIDMLIVGALFAFPTIVGMFAGATYILISDGLAGGQSLGKRIIGLKVICIDTALPCDFKRSIIRNSVFGVVIGLYIILGWIPYVGKFITFIAWAAVITIEMILVYTDDIGARFGDRISGTMVVPGKFTLKF